MRPFTTKAPPRLLVVDDDPVIRASILEALKVWQSMGLVAVSSRSDVAAHILDQDLDLVLLDAGPSDDAGLGALAEIRLLRPDVPVIMLSEHGDERWAVHAIQAGAVDYIPAERIDALLLHAVEVALENIRLARETERLNTDLVGMVSHDIRAPASNVIGFADLLLERGPDAYSPLELRGKLQRIRDNGAYILKLVDDFIDMVRIDCGALRLVLGRHDLGDVVRECLDRCAFFSRSKEIRLVAQVPDVTTMVILDRPKVVQVLSNLLSNAIKFSPEGAEVSVRARLDEREIVFQVEDHGLGIPEAELNLLFRKFSVTSTCATKGEKGSGLGLYIVSEFTKLHKGQVHVDSTKGRGSVFSVHLPQQRRP